MDEDAPTLATLSRNPPAARAIDRHRELFLALRLVDRRIGGRIHDDVRFNSANEARQKFGLRKIALAAIKCYHFPERHQASTEFPSDLTARARDQQPHAKTSALLRGSPKRSFADRIGSPSLGQSIPTSGSFQIRQRSCSGE